MHFLRDKLDWLLREIKSGSDISTSEHRRAVENILSVGQRLQRKEYAWEEKFNPNHKPAGSPGGTGGEFAEGPGGGGSGGSPRVSLPSRKPPVPPLSETNVPPVPKRADGKFPVTENDWQAYHDNLVKAPKVSKTEEKVHATIFAMEGGYDPGRDTETFAGITTDALRDAKKNPVIQDKLGKIHKPIDLKKHPELIPQIYKAHIDHALRATGVDSPLDKVGEFHAAAALGDTIFREGESGGGRIIKKAVLRTNPKLESELDDEQGILKEKTFKAYSKLAKNSATLKLLLDKVAEIRKEGVHKDEVGRIDYFRFQH